MRNTRAGRQFVEDADNGGVQHAMARRDGPRGDDGQAPEDERPDPDNVIEV
jgi:hypothetical protein